MCTFSNLYKIKVKNNNWNKNEKLLVTFYLSDWLFFFFWGGGGGMTPISVDKCALTGLHFEFTLYALLKYVWKSMWQNLKVCDSTFISIAPQNHFLFLLFPLSLLSFTSFFAGNRGGYFWIYIYIKRFFSLLDICVPYQILVLTILKGSLFLKLKLKHNALSLNLVLNFIKS